MPTESKSDSLKDINANDAKNYGLHQACYLRQWRLIQEVEIRSDTEP